MIVRSCCSRAFAAVTALLVGCSGVADPTVNDGVSAVEQGTTPSSTSTGGGASEGSAAGSNANGKGAANRGSANDDGDDAGTSDDASAPVADAAPPSIDAGGCPALTYPSGAVIQTFPDAATTASYANHLASGESAPTCFLDANDLVNPTTGEVYTLAVNVSEHFTLDELVGTEIDQGYGHFVLAVPAAVASLEKFRGGVDEAVDVISGFRSPKHQEDTCKSLCGNPLGCSGTCANNSRHMHGDAFDLPMAFYTSADQSLACTDGFKFSYLESGTHLHVDQNPEYATCVKE